MIKQSESFIVDKNRLKIGYGYYITFSNSLGYVMYDKDDNMLLPQLGHNTDWVTILDSEIDRCLIDTVRNPMIHKTLIMWHIGAIFSCVACNDLSMEYSFTMNRDRIICFLVNNDYFVKSINIVYNGLSLLDIISTVVNEQLNKKPVEIEERMGCVRLGAGITVILDSEYGVIINGKKLYTIGPLTIGRVACYELLLAKMAIMGELELCDRVLVKSFFTNTHNFSRFMIDTL